MNLSPLLFTSLVLIQVPAAAPPAQPANTGDVKALLTAYEKRDQKLPPDPEALAKIARLVMTKTARAQRFPVWSEECASSFASDVLTCSARLQRLFDDRSVPLATRVLAARVLVKRRNEKAAEALFATLKDLPAPQLTAHVETIRMLPERWAVPLLLKMLESSGDGEKIASCRALGRFDSGEVRPALATAVAKASPGLDVWNACMVARARLQEPEPARMITGFSHYMTGEALFDAADAMVATGNEFGVDVLKKLTREASPLVQLDAAERLAEADRETATRVVDAKLSHAQPAVRARALIVERRLNRPASAVVRGLMLDPDELVQLRAAEAILDWALKNKP